MEGFLDDVLTNHIQWIYLVILVWTFFEGETIVIIVGALASSGQIEVDLRLIALCAFLGSFAGDQLAFYIGRFYGTKLLDKSPAMKKKAQWAFQMIEKNKTIFILSFRFIYGVRNAAPFALGIARVSPLYYFFLNMIAALVWAVAFVTGGYLVGKTLEVWIQQYKFHILGGVLLIFAAIYLYSRNKEAAIAIDQEEAR
ncbi:MAG: DedA family protein [Magnetococcales bacterium]|nr:DedA family protein [Magnetococcales bacterium]NGZ29442.1 DedA family protein [Magnetococcales bacterium]